MSWPAVRWAMESGEAKRLTWTGRFVLVTLAYHANLKTGISRPAVETLVSETGLGERTVRRAFGEIERRRDPDTGELVGVLDATRRPGWAIVWHFPGYPQTGGDTQAPLPGGGATQAPGGATQSDAHAQGGATQAPEPSLTVNEPRKARCPHCAGTGWRTGPGGQSFPCRHEAAS